MNFLKLILKIVEVLSKIAQTESLYGSVEETMENKFRHMRCEMGRIIKHW